MSEKEKSEIVGNQYGDATAMAQESTAIQANVDKYADFRAYAYAREKEIFNHVNDLYKATRAEMKCESTTPPELDMPTITMDCDDYADGAIASYNGFSITFYQRANKIFTEMRNAEAHCDTAMAEKLQYYLDEIIGHELGHALSHTIFFNSDSKYDYENGIYRRRDDGMAELIGFYAAQKANGKPIENNSVADAMLGVVLEKQESVIEYNRILLTQWQSLTNKEKLEKIKDIDLHTARSIYYDYAILGFAEALKSNPDMDLAEFIKTALTKPASLDGMNKHVLKIGGAAKELEKMDGDKQQQAFMKMLRQEKDKVDEKQVQEELRLQTELSTAMVDEAAALLKKKAQHKKSNHKG